MCVLYDYNSSSILAEPIELQSTTNIFATYNKLYKILKDRGLTPILARLDNEFSGALKDFFQKNTLDLQLVPPQDHRRISVERAIGFLKDHFIYGLTYLDLTFPMHLWCHLVTPINSNSKPSLRILL